MLFLKPAEQAAMGLVYLALMFLCSCQEKSYYDLSSAVSEYKRLYGYDTDTSIFISEDIIIKDKGKKLDSLFSYPVYLKFLQQLQNTNKFLFVPLSELNSTNSTTKTIIALRHDVDYDINSAMRFAKREHDLGIRATYFILHTADYYSEMPGIINRYKKKFSDIIFRKSNVLEYLRKIQNEYDHEIGWHNDLLTLYAVYNIDPGDYLKEELGWLRGNKINITGTSSHGSEFCYLYHYVNSYLWKEVAFGDNSFFYNYNSITVKNEVKPIKKYNLSDFGFEYEAGLFNVTAFYADVPGKNKKRWHPSMIDWNSFKPGDKVIILFHPSSWDSF